MEERTKQRTQRRVKQESYFDYSLLFIIIFLLCFGLVMIYSASSYEAQTEFGNASYYARKQLFSTVLGLIAMFFVTMLDYHIWYRFSGLAYVVSGILILLVMKYLLNLVEKQLN